MDLYRITSQDTLERIARHCPSALGAYLHCINNADEEGKVFFSRDQVEISMSERWTPFKNQIKKLALEGLLIWHPVNNGISATLVGEDEGS